MAISSSGAVSFANVQTEYGGSNPISLNEYYSGGSLVKANTSSTANSSTIVGTTYSITSGKIHILNDLMAGLIVAFLQVVRHMPDFLLQELKPNQVVLQKYREQI